MDNEGLSLEEYCERFDNQLNKALKELVEIENILNKKDEHIKHLQNYSLDLEQECENYDVDYQHIVDKYSKGE